MHIPPVFDTGDLRVQFYGDRIDFILSFYNVLVACGSADVSFCLVSLRYVDSDVSFCEICLLLVYVHNRTALRNQIINLIQNIKSDQL